MLPDFLSPPLTHHALPVSPEHWRLSPAHLTHAFSPFFLIANLANFPLFFTAQVGHRLPLGTIYNALSFLVHCTSMMPKQYSYWLLVFFLEF